MPLTHGSPWRDIREISEENLREAVAYVLEGLACSVLRGTETVDFKLPFEVNIRIEQECCDWTVKATTTLEYKQEWLDEMDADTKRTIEMWAKLDE